MPRQDDARMLSARLREIRVRSGGAARARGVSDLMIQEQRGTFAAVGDFLVWLGPARRLQEYIEQANLKYKSSDVLTLCIAIAAGAFLLLSLLGMNLMALRMLVSLALGSLPIFYIRRVRDRRLTKFEENLPDAIDLFNPSMKAGHNIHSGLETLSLETTDPVRMEFRKVVEELALGSQLEAALHGLGRRVPIIDLKFFVTGLILQRQNRRQHGDSAGEPLHTDPRAPEPRRQNEGRHDAAALLRRPALHPAARRGARLLGGQTRIHSSALHR
ncbi:MAG: type II secretion system F family protein [Bryobacterales bacterium]|nr:type II secretion system F family protein [Bryobacterales bacterium]